MAFPGFKVSSQEVDSKFLGQKIKIHTLKGGQGPPLLLLHGYPQTSHIWNKVAPVLAEKYTVVITDLRGYGQSDKPKGSDNHAEYSKKEMAADQVQVMSQLGFDSFFLVGHDRGARVAHRLAMDHPDHVKKLMLLDIIPTLWLYTHVNFTFAYGYWHWFWLIQPAPGPEDSILAAPEEYWRSKMGTSESTSSYWSESDVKVYKDRLSDPAAVHASCEDYRAGVSIDMKHDQVDRDAGKRITTPHVRVIWGKQGFVENMGNTVEIWQDYSADGVKVTGRSMDCGHYIPEEKPDELTEEILKFMV